MNHLLEAAVGDEAAPCGITFCAARRKSRSFLLLTFIFITSP